MNSDYSRMKTLLVGIAAFCFVMALSVPGFVHAQSALNPNVLPLGDKESLMANTGTGGIGSTGAVYYNPGALTMVQGNSFSLSGSAYLSFKFKADPIANVAGTDLSYDGNGFQTTPTTIIIVKKRKEWYCAFSVLVPMEFNFEGQTKWNVPIGGDNLKMRIDQNYKEKIFLAGLTFARKINDTWSAGITLYGQAYNYLSFLNLRGELESNPDEISQFTSREKISPVSILSILGIHRRTEKLNMGLRVALPSLYLFGKGAYYEYEYSNLGGDVITSEVDVEDEKAKFVTPLDICWGTAYMPNDRWTLALDLAYRMGIDYYIYPDNPLGEKTLTKGNIRVNGGFEFRVKEKLAMYGGASYTPTTIEETEDTFGQNYWAVFGGGKLFTEHIETSLGLFYSLGKGEGNLSVGEGRTTQTHEYFGIVLGTNYKF